VDDVYASAKQRDRFLNALDAQDICLCQRLAADLINCGNALPGMTCKQLGLPPGSTYGSAARTVVSMRELHVAAPDHSDTSESR